MDLLVSTLGITELKCIQYRHPTNLFYSHKNPIYGREIEDQRTDIESVELFLDKNVNNYQGIILVRF